MAAVAAYDRANSVPDKSGGDPITRFSRPVLRKLPSRTIVQRESRSFILEIMDYFLNLFRVKIEIFFE